MSEIAVVAARKVRLQQRAEEGDDRAKRALELAHDPNRFLSTVQFGITMVGVLAGAYGDPIGAARAGVRFARESGGRDNITVVVLRVPEGAAETGPQESTAAAEPSVPTAANRSAAFREHAQEQGQAPQQAQAQQARQEEET